MNPDIRKQLWLAIYALNSFEKSEQTCTHLIDHCVENTHPLFAPLSMAVHIYYARPFLKSNGIDQRYIYKEDHIPSSLKELHDFLFTFRNKIFAHVEALTIEEFGFEVHDVVVKILPNKEKILSPSTPTGIFEAYKEALHVIKYMKLKAESKVSKIIDENKEFFPVEIGEYTLLLKGDTAFKRHQ